MTNWAFCAGMPRSGSTLQYQLVADVIERSGLGERIGWITPEEFPSIQQQKQDANNFLVLKSHKYIPEAKAYCEAGNGTVFYVYRDIRDVAVSLHNKHGTSIENILKTRALEGCISDYELWTSLPNTLVMQYEKMVADLPEAVSQIGHHLGVDLSTETCIEIAAMHTPSKQKERIAELKSKLDGTGEKTGYDSSSLLHHNHIHSGESGQWKTHMTPQQLRDIERKFGSWLDKHDYQADSWLNAIIRNVHAFLSPASTLFRSNSSKSS